MAYSLTQISSLRIVASLVLLSIALYYNIAFAVGLGMQYNFSSCIGLKIEGEYDYSKMVFSFSTGNGVRNDYRNISYINTTLGLVILF